MLDGELRSRKPHTGAKKIKNKNKQTKKKWGRKEHLPHRVNARIKWVQSPETTGTRYCLVPSYVFVLSRSVVSDSSVTPWTVGRQAPLSMEFSRQEDWSGLPFFSPGNLLYMGLLHCRKILYHLSHQGSLLLRDISKYKDRST